MGRSDTAEVLELRRVRREQFRRWCEANRERSREIARASEAKRRAAGLKKPAADHNERRMAHYWLKRRLSGDPLQSFEDYLALMIIRRIDHTLFQ